MLPLALTVKDFLSYGPEPQTLPFEQLTVACLHGPNGAGKSALFDALTWALWGKARCVSDDLVRRGADAAVVSLLFRVGPTTYQINRTFHRPSGKHNVALFQINDGSTLTLAEGVRAVRAAIAELLRLPFETFVATAYFKQNDAAYFTKALAPRQRKEILFHLLGLDQLTAIGDAAADALKKEKDILNQLKGEISALKIEVEKIPTARERLTAAERLHREASRHYDQATAAVTAARRAENEAKEREAALRIAAERAAAWERSLAAARNLAREANEKRRRAEAILARAEEITTRHAAAIENRQVLETLEKAAARYAALKRERDEILLRAEGRRRELEKGIARSQERVTFLVTEIRELESVVAELSQWEAQTQRLRELEHLQTEFEKSEREYRLWQEKLATAKAAYAEKEKAFLREREKLEARRRALSVPDINALEREAKTLTSRCDYLRQLLTDYEVNQRRVNEYENMLASLTADAAAAASRIHVIQTRISALGTTEMNCPTCRRPLEGASLEAAKENLAAEVAAEETVHNRLRSRVAEVGAALAKAYEAVTNAIGARDELEKLQSELERVLAELASARRARAAYEELNQALAEVQDALASLKSSAEKIAADEAERHLTTSPYDPQIVEKLKEEIKSLAPAPVKAEEARRTRERLTARQEELKTASTKFEEMKRELTGDTLTPAERSRLRVLEKELSALAFDEDALYEARRRQAAFADAEVEFRELQLAGEIAKEADAEAERAAAEIARAEKELTSLRAELARREEIIRAVAQKARDLTSALAEEEKALAELHVANKELGAARNELGRLEEKYRFLTDALKKAEETERRVAIDAYVARAFGPDGIPALMTDAALAELETEANDVLARLTDGRITLALRTERTTKTGGAADTLDVVLAENGEVRPYDSFSGGEAFRADFALRLGLSRLLARRAGVPLRFLVIDEGFGSQDAEGLRALVEVINGIRDYYDKILVISHLINLKEEFPQRVEVFKDEEGYSRLRVAS